MIGELPIMALNTENRHNSSLSGTMFNHSDADGGVGYVRGRLDTDFEKIVAFSSRTQKKRKPEIEEQGKVVKDFKVGNVRVKINDAYCRDKTPAEVQSILAGISSRTQEQFTAQEAAKQKL